MIPLTFLAISWIFNPSVVDFSQLTHFQHTNGTGFFSPLFGHGWLTISVAFSFLLTWNVIAMEAAACYIGETRDPDRDAKIAMNLEGGYGVFIYTMIPIAFVIVLGVHALGNHGTRRPQDDVRDFRLGGVRDQQGLDRARRPDRDHADPGADPVRAERDHGTARSLHQMSADGHFPKFFSRTNSHGVPGHSMAFNVVCAIIVVFMGGAVQIYTFSNVGYLFSFIPVLIGYYCLRQWRPNVRRPYRLPEWMKYAALALAFVYAVIYVWGGPMYASCTCSQAGKSTLPYYFIGIGVLLAYLPLYWYRKRVEDKRDAPPAPEQASMMAATGTGP